MKSIRTLLLGAFGILTITGTAFAADVGQPMYTKVPAPAPVFSWTGLHLGGTLRAA